MASSAVARAQLARAARFAVQGIVRVPLLLAVVGLVWLAVPSGNATAECPAEAPTEVATDTVPGELVQPSSNEPAVDDSSASAGSQDSGGGGNDDVDRSAGDPEPTDGPSTGTPLDEIEIEAPAELPDVDEDLPLDEVEDAVEDVLPPVEIDLLNHTVECELNTVRVRPAVARPGGVIVVDGAGFSPGEVAISLLYANSLTLVEDVGEADDAGVLAPRAIQIDPDATGSVVVVAQQVESGHLAQGTFEADATAPAPALSHPATDYAGRPLTVQGSGFVPEQDATVSLLAEGAAIETVTARIGEGGLFSTTLTLPPDERTGYTVTALAQESGERATGRIDVLPRPTLNITPSRVAPGDTLTVSGQCATASAVQLTISPVDVSPGTPWDVQRRTTTPDGQFSFSVPAPRAAAGSYRVQLDAERTEGTAACIGGGVTLLPPAPPALTFAPDVVPAGGVTTAVVRNFEPRETVVVDTPGAWTATLVTDEIGAGVAKITVPRDAFGRYTSTARGNATGTEAIAGLDVTPLPAHLTVVPQRARPNGVITVTGSGFPGRAPAEVVLTCDGARRTRSAGAVADGALAPIRLDVPAAAQSTCVVAAAVSTPPADVFAFSSRRSEVARLTLPVVTLSPSIRTVPAVVRPGDSFEVIGTNFHPGEVVNVTSRYMQRASGYQVTATPDPGLLTGSFTLRLQAPSTAVGRIVVRALGDRGSRSVARVLATAQTGATGFPTFNARTDPADPDAPIRPEPPGPAVDGTGTGSAPSLAGPGSDAGGGSASTASAADPLIADGPVSFTAKGRTGRNLDGAGRARLPASLPRPDRGLLDPVSLLMSLLVSAAFILVMLCSGELFNTVLEEHHDEIVGWFRRIPLWRAVAEPLLAAASTRGGLAGFFVAMSVLGALLDPSFGVNRPTLALILGMAGQLVVITMLLYAAYRVYAQKRYRAGVRLRALPGGLTVAVACVLISRAVHFEPGYLFGVVAAVIVQRELSRREEGKVLAAFSVALLLAVAAAWVAWASVDAALTGGETAFGFLLADAFLASLVVSGVEILAFGLLPLSFLNGEFVKAWSKTAWAVLQGIGMFAFVHVILHPRTGFRQDVPQVLTTVLFGSFALVSLGLWAYFRFRPRPATT